MANASNFYDDKYTDARDRAGKSTLLLHTNGLLLPDSGEVNVGDVPVSKKTLKLVRQSVGMVFQNPDD